MSSQQESAPGQRNPLSDTQRKALHKGFELLSARQRQLETPHSTKHGRRKAICFIAAAAVTTATLLGLKPGSVNEEQVKQTDGTSSDVDAPDSSNTIYYDINSTEPQNPYGIPPGISAHAGIKISPASTPSIEYVQTEEQRREGK